MIRINCDLCGKASESLNRTLIEGVELDVCSECSRFGKIISPVRRLSPKEQHKQFLRKSEPQKEEKIELLVENYAEIIKKKRESMGLTQKEFASRVNEKESAMHKIETGMFNPTLPLAKKLEKALGIKIVEEHEERHEKPSKSRMMGFTLGDFIKIKK
ncbi:TIGR00270 family protein [Candidatus Woesearchaeota archaeon]|nr:TIGR00270 family protein [Candidatus Woesearchaeota archaeon]